MSESIATLLEQFHSIESSVADFVAHAFHDKFFDKEGDAWSAGDYFKHMLLAFKPFVKAIEMPKDTLTNMFGESGRASRSAETIVAEYKKRLAEGVRAEDAPTILPVNYRLPEDLTDEKAFLVQQWHDAHQRLYRVMENLSEADLDALQLPHPAIGVITLREMLYFTAYHNTLHWHDMQVLVH